LINTDPGEEDEEDSGSPGSSALGERADTVKWSTRSYSVCDGIAVMRVASSYYPSWPNLVKYESNNGAQAIFLQQNSDICADITLRVTGVPDKGYTAQSYASQSPIY